MTIVVPPAEIICTDVDPDSGGDGGHSGSGGHSGGGEFGSGAQGIGGADPSSTTSDGTPHLSINLGAINPAVNSDFPPGTNDFAHYRAKDLGDGDFKVEAFLHLSIAGTTVVTGSRSIDGTLTRVRQFQTIDGLTEVAEIGTRILRVEVNRLADIESDGGGLFRRKAGASPLVTYLIEDPTPADANDKALRFTETRGVGTRWTSYIYSATGAYWELTRSNQPGSIRFSTSGGDTKKTVWLDSNGTPLQERQVTVDASGRTLSIKSGNSNDGNSNGGTPLVEEHYSYAASAYTTGDYLAFVRRIMNGVTVDWTRTIQDYDAVSTVRPYLDGPTLPADPTESTDNTLRLFREQGAVTTSDSAGTTQKKPDNGIPRTVYTETIARTLENYPLSPDPNNPWKVQVENQSRLPSAFGNNLTRVTKRFADTDVPWPYQGKLHEETDEQGRLRSYQYERGIWTPNEADPMAGAFTPDPTGFALKTTVTEAVPQQGGTAPMAGVTQRDITISDEHGRIVRQENWIHGGATPLRVDVTSYDSEGRVKMRHRDGRKIYESSYSDGRLAWELDAMGRKTRYEDYDDNNRSRRIVLEGLPAAAGYPAIPDQITTLTYDITGTLRERKVVRGASEETWRWDYDTAGRLRFTHYRPAPGQSEQTTEIQYHGLTRTEIAPSGNKVIEERYMDGRIKSRRQEANVGGVVTAFGQQSMMASVDAEGFETTTTTVGTGAATMVSAQKVDWLGNVILATTRGDDTVNGGIIEDISTYENGRLATEQRSGLAPAVRGYFFGAALNVSGEVETTTQDSGTDGIRETTAVRHYEELPDGWYAVTKSQRGGQTFTTKSKVGGFAANELSKSISIDGAGIETMGVRTIDWETLVETETLTRTGLNPVTTVSRAGLVYSRNTPSVQKPVVYTYDDRGRMLTATDPRTDSLTSTTYDPVSGQPETVTAPGNAVACTYYPLGDYRAGKMKSETVNGQTRYFDYDAAGRQFRVWGVGQYPVEYGYDAAGRLVSLRTFRIDAGWTGATWPVSASGQGDLTQWVYYPQSNLLAQKLDASGKGASYQYNAAGQLRVRAWARAAGAITTTYSYNDAGEIKGADYSDNTPDVTFGYNAVGQMTSVTDAAGSHVLEYANGRFEKETITGGVLDGWVLDPAYAGDGQLTGLGGSFNGSAVISQSFTPQTGTNRIETVSEALVPGGALNVNYAYLPDSDLLWTATTTQGGAERLKVTRDWDEANRLKKIATTRGVATVASYEWAYDAAGRRERATLADNSYWEYSYNARNEVTSGTRKLAGGAAQAGYAFGYEFDPIGNRRSTATNGRSASYTPNQLNQYESREVPGVVDILAGTEEAAGTSVRVTGPQGTVAATKQGTSFHAAVPVGNTSAARFPTLTVSAVKGGGSGGTDYEQSATGAYFLPQTPESFSYDDDGNLTSDGRWSYTWDAENRLIAVETRPQAVSAGVPRQKLEFQYDYRGRRISKKISTWDGTQFGTTTETRFLYDDGWNLLAELDVSGTLMRRYLWGSDLGGSRQGAGGVGGLLASWGPAGAQLPFYDGNGNVMGYLDAASGSETARYEYGPFGELLRATGALAESNPFGWSTHYFDREGGIVYAKYRYFSPSMGCWLSRDLISERGGINLVNYVANNPIRWVDPYGLRSWSKDIEIEGSVMFGTTYTATITVTYDDEACAITLGSPVFTGMSVAPPNSADVLTNFEEEDSKTQPCCDEEDGGERERTVLKKKLRIRQYTKVGYKGLSYTHLDSTSWRDLELTCKCK